MRRRCSHTPGTGYTALQTISDLSEWLDGRLGRPQDEENAVPMVENIGDMEMTAALGLASPAGRTIGEIAAGGSALPLFTALSALVAGSIAPAFADVALVRWTGGA